MNKIFVCGKVYDMSALSVDKIEKRVQNRINRALESEFCDEQLVTFSLKTDKKNRKIDYHFRRINLFAKYGHNPDFVNDSDAQLVCGLFNGSFKLPVMWQFVDYFAPGRYYVSLLEFVDSFASSAFDLGADQIEGMAVDSTKDEFILRLKF